MSFFYLIFNVLQQLRNCYSALHNFSTHCHFKGHLIIITENYEKIENFLNALSCNRLLAWIFYSHVNCISIYCSGVFHHTVTRWCSALSQPSSTAMGSAQLFPPGIVKDISLEISDPQSPQHSSPGSFGQFCRPSCRTTGIAAVWKQPKACDNSKPQKLKLLARHGTLLRNQNKLLGHCCSLFLSSCCVHRFFP